MGNPPSKFRRAFQKVLEAGVPCVLHAGETEGPASIWNAIEVANPKRIGHGVRAIEDPKLMDYLKQTQLPLEVCPTSNICLGVFPSLEKHSLPKLLDHGLKVTINSDDPPMFNTTLTDEFLVARSTFRWDGSLVRQLVLNAVEVNLLRESEKKIMLRDFVETFRKLDSQAG
jgi:adenosine deaminase